MIIDSVSARAVEIPLRRDFVTSVRRDAVMKGVLVEITSTDGVSGHGEAPQNTRLTGETVTSITAFVDVVAPLIRGAHVHEYRTVLEELDSIPFNSSAKSGIAGALTDLAAKTAGVSLHGMFGGRPRVLTNNMTISLGAPDRMLADAREAVRNGYSVLKVKLDGDEDANLRRVQLLAANLPASTRYRVDPNQSWSRKSAVRQIAAISDLLLVELVEQPVHRADLTGMRFVRDNVSVPVAADEAVFSEADALRVLENEAADVLNVKLVKCGGAPTALRIADLAEQFGVRCMVGCTTETQLSLASSAAVAVAHRNVGFVDLDGACHLTGLPFADPFESYGPRIEVGTAPGCGVREIDFGSAFFAARELADAADR